MEMDQHRHLEIVIIATAPEYQGRGFGTALFRFLGEVADADGVPSHLETVGLRNVGFYAKRAVSKWCTAHPSPVSTARVVG
jgi:GNAT superfamily N-acetyltransferase